MSLSTASTATRTCRLFKKTMSFKTKLVTKEKTKAKDKSSSPVDINKAPSEHRNDDMPAADEQSPD